MVLPHNFVLLQIPALYLFVFSRWKKVGVSVREGKASNSVNVTCQGHFKLACHQVPEFDCPIIAAWNKKAVQRINCDAANPAIVAGYYCL